MTTHHSSWDSENDSEADKNLRQALSNLATLKEKLSLSDLVTEKAAELFKQALYKELPQSHPAEIIPTLISTVVYASCGDSETPRTLKDVADAGNIEKKDIVKYYDLFQRELGFKIPSIIQKELATEY